MVSAPSQAGALVLASQPPPVRPSVRLPAWLEVAKPRLIPLLLATTLAGMAVSDPSGAGPVQAGTVLATLLGGSLAAAAAGVLNCVWEQDLDGRMQRTSRRALPSGRLDEGQALGLAALLTSGAVLVMVLAVNALAASLALLGLCSYVLLYTALLKPRTSQNIVIG
ncbi:MAG: UbiA family prenyltransferase, partial [Cyanobium sp.]